MAKILFIIGSLREKSFNRVLAHHVAKELEGKAEVEFLDYSDIPWINQDIEFPAPESVQRIRKQVEEADGIWIFTPEYNHSYPGPLKNTLDWLSRPLVAGDPDRISSIRSKKAIASSLAGSTKGEYVRANLEKLFALIGVAFINNENAGYIIPGESWATDELIINDEIKNQVAAQIEEFLIFLES